MTDISQNIVDLMKGVGLPARHSYEKKPPQLPCITIMLSEVKPRHLLDKKLFATTDTYEMTVWSQDKDERGALLRRAFDVLSPLGFSKFNCRNSFDEAAQAHKVHCYIDFMTMFGQAES